MVWFSPGVPSARKVINTFIYRKHDALQSMNQGSCIIEAILIKIGVYTLYFKNGTETDFGSHATCHITADSANIAA